MVTPGLYCGLNWTPKASATFPKKVHRHGISFLADLGLQGHQMCMADSLDLCTKKSFQWHSPEDLNVGTNGPGPLLCQIYFIQALGVLALFLGAWQYFILMHSCSQGIQPPTMVGHFPGKPYVGLGSDLEVTWARSRSDTLICFSNCDILAAFR